MSDSTLQKLTADVHVINSQELKVKGIDETIVVHKIQEKDL